MQTTFKNYSMKSSLKLFLIVLISTFIVSCSISNKPDVVFEKHDTAKGATYVSLPPSLARKYVSSEMQNDKELREVLEEIKTFKALIIQKDEAEIDIETEILQPIKSYAREKKMQDLVRFSQHGNEIMVKAHDKGHHF